MMRYSEVHRRLQDRTITAISNATGLARTTLIFIRDNDKPGGVEYRTIEILSDYFYAQEQAGEKNP